MNRIFFRLFAGVFIVLTEWCLPAEAQFVKRHMQDYSRWSVEVNAGVPFLVGSLTSFAADETYLGMFGNVGVGFQYTPVWGFRISAEYGKTKAGAREYAADFLLGEDGMTYYLPMPFETWKYRDVYSRIEYLGIGLHADINIVNLLGGSASDYRWTFLLSPAVYVKQFSPEVRTVSGDKVLFSPSSGLCAGLGGDLTARVRLSRLFDLQFRTGVAWISDNQFVGFDTPVLARYNYSWNTSVGIVFKWPQRGKREHLMYMPRNGVCYWRH